MMTNPMAPKYKMENMATQESKDRRIWVKAPRPSDMFSAEKFLPLSELFWTRRPVPGTLRQFDRTRTLFTQTRKNGSTCGRG